MHHFSETVYMWTASDDSDTKESNDTQPNEIA